LIRLISGMITAYCMDNRKFRAWVTIIVSIITYYAFTMTVKLIYIYLSTMWRHEITPKNKQYKTPKKRQKGCNKYYYRSRHKTRIGVKRDNKRKLENNAIKIMTTTQCVGCPIQENGIKIGPNMDSNSYQIAIDSCCSYSIAKSRKHFAGPLVPCNIKIQGLAGTCTVKWDNQDHQHWSQQSKNPSGTYCKVGHQYIELI